MYAGVFKEDPYKSRNEKSYNSTQSMFPAEMVKLGGLRSKSNKDISIPDSMPYQSSENSSTEKLTLKPLFTRKKIR